MEPQRREDGKEGFFGTNFTDYTVFLDRIYRINWILFCLSSFPDESLKTKSLREKEKKEAGVTSLFRSGSDLSKPLI